MERTLWYECAPRPFFPPARVRCHREQIGHLKVFEYRRRSKTCPYGLRIEARVRTKEEVRAYDREARELVASISGVWPYVAGTLLFPRWVTIQVSKSPQGWRTNSQRILSAVPAAGPSMRLRFGRASSYSMTLPYLPLRNALIAVPAYRTANATTRALLDLHLQAMALPGTESGLFLLAKALELARVMLPGRDDRAREAVLPLDARRALRRSLHGLYEIANKRRGTRHVVSGKTKSLLPQLTQSEHADFLHDADLVIRGVVERELHIPVVVVNRASENAVSASALVRTISP